MPLVGRVEKGTSRAGRGSSEIVDGDLQCPGSRDQTAIIAGQPNNLTVRAQELHGREVECVEGAHRFRKGLQGPGKDRGSQLDQRSPTDQRSHVVSMSPTKPARVNPGPDLVLQEPTGDQ